MSVNIALIRSLYPDSRLGRGVGLNALVVGVSFAIGPSIASLVLALGPWPWLFAINVPLGLLALAFAWPALPRVPGNRLPFDPVTAALAALTFSATLLTLISAAQRAGAVSIMAAVMVAAVSGAILLRRQSGDPAPMLPVDLFRRPLFALSSATAIASFSVQGLAFVSLPFYFEQVLHRDPIQTGILMAPWAIVVALAAPIAGRLSDRYPPGLLGGIGLALLSAGMLALAFLPGTEPSVVAIAWRMSLCGLGFGLFQSPNLKAIMTSAPPSRSGGASGVIAMSRLTGQASGAALVALCFGWGGAQGSAWALGLGAALAALAAALSSARLWAR